METLKDVRKSKGLTLKNMADKLGISLCTYKNYESGVRGVSTENANKICTILGVKRKEFFLPTEYTIRRKQ